MLARLKRFSFISIPNDRQFVKRVSEKNLMDFAILRGIRGLRAEKPHRQPIAQNQPRRTHFRRLPMSNASPAEILAQKNASFSTMIARENPLVNGEKNPPESCVIRGDNAYRSPLRPRLRLTRRTGCPAFFFAPDAFVRATGLLAGALSTRTGVPPRRILPSLPMTTG